LTGRKLLASFGRAGASAGVPTIGKSAIDVEQPPSASADSNSAAANTPLFRSTRIRLKIPLRRQDELDSRPTQITSTKGRPVQTIVARNH
jgi:hypothetical protein